MGKKDFVMKKSDISNKKKELDFDDVIKKEISNKTVVSGRIKKVDIDKTVLVNINDIEFEKETLNISDLLIKKDEKKVISVEEILTTVDNYDKKNKVASLYNNYKKNIKDENTMELDEISIIDESTIDLDENLIFKSKDFKKDENTINIDDEIGPCENYLDVEIEFEVKTLLDLIKYNKVDEFDERLKECQVRYDSNVFILIRYMFEGYVKD